LNTLKNGASGKTWQFIISGRIFGGKGGMNIFLG
jgi:hypothetical protein